VCGNIARPGNYEVTLGFPFKDFLYDLCGGPLPGRRFKAVIPGGSSVPIQTMEEAEATLMDYEGFVAKGTMLGSGGVIVFDDSVCMVKMIARLARFYAHESCAQCTQCRDGLDHAHPEPHRSGRRHEAGPRHVARPVRRHDGQDDLRAERLVRGADRERHPEVPA
jgi:NADH:ubiquinone oxidoreductase subunit F (NADH-binding)